MFNISTMLAALAGGAGVAGGAGGAGGGGGAGDGGGVGDAGGNMWRRGREKITDLRKMWNLSRVLE